MDTTQEFRSAYILSGTFVHAPDDDGSERVRPLLRRKAVTSCDLYCVVLPLFQGTLALT